MAELTKEQLALATQMAASLKTLEAAAAEAEKEAEACEKLLGGK